MAFDMVRKLTSKFWRMNHLYVIKDKYAKQRIMQLNQAQLHQYNSKHNKDITLKSRQQGISTYKVEEALDKCLMIPNHQAGIQSYGLRESQKLYQKAYLMYYSLPKSLLSYLGVTLVSASQTNGFVFSNGSSLRIGNFRGDTLQSVHVSELAKIAKVFPDKALELKTGAFEAVAVNSEISIESTAEGNTGMFFDMWNTAEKVYAEVDYNEKELTPLDFKPIFLPWTIDPDCNMKEKKKILPHHEEYFHEVEEYMKDHVEYRQIPILDEYGLQIDTKEIDWKLTPSQQHWYVGKKNSLGEYFDREYPFSPDSAFKSFVEGTFFKEQYIKLNSEKIRMYSGEYRPGYPVIISFDIGVNDYTILLFSQALPRKLFPEKIQALVPKTITHIPVIFDEYETNKTVGVDFFADYIRRHTDPVNRLSTLRDLKHIVFPHDAKALEWSTGESRISKMKQQGLPVYELKHLLAFEDSIHLARNMINFTVFGRVPHLLSAIQSYRRRFDKVNQVFLPSDVHNKDSDYAASYRYLSQYFATTRMIYKP